MARKIVGFTIEIDGKNELVKTEKILKLINKDLVQLNKNLNNLDKTAGKGFGKLNAALLKTTSSSSKLGSTIENAFVSFEKGNEIVRGTGDEFKQLTKQIESSAKAAKKKAKEDKEGTVTDAQRIRQLNKLVELSAEQEKELNGLLKAQAKARNLAKERAAIAKQEAILETERVGTRKALKAQLALVTIELNKLTEAEQKNTKEGRRLTAQQLKLNQTLFDLEKSGGTFSRRVGEYTRGLIDLEKISRKSTSTLKRFALRLTVGRSVVGGLAKGVQSAVQGLQRLVEEGDGTNEVFNELQESGAGLQATLTRVGTEFLGAFGSGIAKIIDNVSFVISVVSENLIEASESTGLLGTILRTVGDILTNFPAIFGGIIEASKEFAAATSRAFTSFSVNVKLAYQNFLLFSKGLAGFDTTETEKNIERLNQELIKNAEGARSLGQAYTDGYNATIKAQEEFNKRSEEEVKIQERRQKAIERREKAAKEAAEAERKRIEEEKRAAEQLQADRAELLETFKQEAEERKRIAEDLQKELVDLQIEAIKDETQRAIAAENERFARQKEARETNFRALQDQATAQELEAARLFGEDSEQEMAIIEQNNEELLELTLKNDELAEQQEQAHQDALLAIKKEAADQAAEQEKEAAEKAAAAQAKTDEEAEQKAIEQEKQTLERKKKNIDAVVSIFNSSFDLIENLSAIGAEAEQRRFDEAIQARQKSIESLNSQLQNATGLQKQFLEQQVKQEKEALEEEEKNREAAERKRVKAAQALALVQAAINGAIAITRAFSDLGPIAGAVAAVGVGAATVAQVAEISSQKFAKGGVINGASHADGGVPVFGGRVELEGEEGIINKNSMKNPLLRSIASFVNEAGGGDKFVGTKSLGSFATGGIIGAPSAAPQVSSNADKVLAALDRKTDAINRRIDNINVALDVNNLQDFEGNEAKLQALTTLA